MLNELFLLPRVPKLRNIHREMRGAAPTRFLHQQTSSNRPRRGPAETTEQLRDHKALSHKTEPFLLTRLTSFFFL